MILKFNNQWLKTPTHVLGYKEDPYNPLNLPSHVIRCKFKAGYTPTEGDTQTLVDAEQNIWDIYKASDDWNNLLSRTYDHSHEDVLLEVLGANTTGVTDMHHLFFYNTALSKVALFDTSSVTLFFYMFCNTAIEEAPLYDTSNGSIQGMFNRCSKLKRVPLYDTSSTTSFSQLFNNCSALEYVPNFDTSNITDMYYAFFGCSSLKSLPLFDTSKVTTIERMCDGTGLTNIPDFDVRSVTNANYAFAFSGNVNSGITNLYNKLSALSDVSHECTFRLTGVNTSTGAAELAQIPDDWK